MENPNIMVLTCQKGAAGFSDVFECTILNSYRNQVFVFEPNILNGHRAKCFWEVIEHGELQNSIFRIP